LIQLYLIAALACIPLCGARFARSTDADNIRPTGPDIIPVALRANLKVIVLFRHIYLKYGSSELISNIIDIIVG